MKVELEMWHLVLLFAMFSGACWAFARVFFAQFEKRLSERFASQEVANKTIQDAVSKLLAEETRALGMVQALEREFLTWRGDLPMQYVRREDYIRNQTVIESKLDSIRAKMEVLQLRGSND